MNRRDRRELARQAAKMQGLHGREKQEAVRRLATAFGHPQHEVPRLEEPRKRTLRQRVSGLIVPSDE